jgi:hypothetical protein
MHSAKPKDKLAEIYSASKCTHDYHDYTIIILSEFLNEFF